LTNYLEIYKCLILRSPRFRDFDLSSIKRIWYGTAPMPVEWLKEGIKVFGPVFRQNYGMTEMAQPITFLRPEGTLLERFRPPCPLIERHETDTDLNPLLRKTCPWKK